MILTVFRSGLPGSTLPHPWSTELSEDTISLVNRTGIYGSGVDYSKYVSGGLTKTDKHGAPTLLDFTLTDINDGTSVKLPRGTYIFIGTSTYGIWFTGYITNDPELQFIGSHNGVPMYGYKYEATSDDYILNLKPVGLIPPFINCTYGTIVKKLVTVLAPGIAFDTTNVQDGPLLSRYQVDPTKHFSDIISDLCKQSYYNFTALNGALSFVPADAGTASITIDGNDSNFTPSRLSISPSTDPIVNDVIVLGDIEPQNYVTELLVGDGWTAQFNLISNVYGTDSTLLLDDDFSNSQIDTTKWSLYDTAADWIQLANGYVNALGGDGSYESFLQSLNLIPLEGNLRFTHGEYDFVESSDGVVGGLWSGDMPDTFAPTGPTWASGFSVPIGTELSNGLAEFSFQVDGNLVLYSNGNPMWQTPVKAPGGTLIMQTDGNLVMKDSDGDVIWASGSGGHAGAYIQLTQMGAATIYATDGTALWSTAPEPNLSFAGCLYGLRCTKDGFNTVVCPLVSGVADTTQSFTIDYGSRYVMRTVMESYHTWRTSSGYTNRTPQGTLEISGNGGTQGTVLTFQTFISALDPITAEVKAQYHFANVIPVDIDLFYAYYVPIALSDLHCSMTGVTISQPLQASMRIKAKGAPFETDMAYTGGVIVRPTTPNGFLYKCTGTGVTGDTEPVWPAKNNATITSGTDNPVTFTAQVDDWISQIIGPNEIDSVDGQTPAATIVDANNGVTTKSSMLGSALYNPVQASLQFFKESNRMISNVPQLGDLVLLRYRKPGAAIGRVQDPANVESEAAAWGDNGIRSTTRRDLSPLPRTQQECEFAAKAILADSSYAHFTGTYTMPSGPWFSSEPVSGTMLPFTNLPNGFPTTLQAELITQVVSTLRCISRASGKEFFDHTISFGGTDYMDSVLSKLTRTNDVFAPQDSVVMPFFVTADVVGTQYADDVVAPNLISWDRDNLYLDMGQDLPTYGEFELRMSDESWGPEPSKNFIGRYDVSSPIPIPRNIRSKFVAVRVEDGRNWASYSEDLTQTSIWTMIDGATVTNKNLPNPDDNNSPISVVVMPDDANGVSQTIAGLPIIAQCVFSVSVKGTPGNRVKLVEVESDTVVSVTLTGRWQRVSLLFLSAGSADVRVISNSRGPQTVQITRVQVDAQPVESAYCRTTNGRYGALSRYSTVLHIALPLIPPPPSGTVDISDPANPVVNVVTPNVLSDVWGIEIRDSDDSTVLYHMDLTDSGYQPTFTIQNNTVRSRVLHLYTYNILKEFSDSFALTVAVPAPATPVIKLGSKLATLIEIDLDKVTTPVVSTTVQISTDVTFPTAHTDTITQTGQPPNVHYSSPDGTQTRYARAKRTDTIGDGAWSSTLTIPQTNFIDSGFLRAQGGIIPMSDDQVAALFSYTATSFFPAGNLTNVITITWPAFNIVYSNGDTQPVAAGSYSDSHLVNSASSLTYCYFPVIVPVNGSAVQFVQFNTGLGYNQAGVMLSPGNPFWDNLMVTFAKDCQADGLVGLGGAALSFQTIMPSAPTSGGGGGHGGGGSGGGTQCVVWGETVYYPLGEMNAEEVNPGVLLQGADPYTGRPIWNAVVKVRKSEAECVEIVLTDGAKHKVSKGTVMAAMKRGGTIVETIAGRINLSCRLFSRRSWSWVEVSAVNDIGIQDVVSIELAPSHWFFVSDVLSHNNRIVKT